MISEEIPGFQASIDAMPADSKIFVDKSLAIADRIQTVMAAKGLKQRDLAQKMGKTEAEVSKLLGGMHNYTLRSLSKIEAALGVDVIGTPVHTVIAYSKKELSYKPASVSELMQLPVSPKLNYAKVVPFTTPEKAQAMAI